MDESARPWKYWPFSTRNSVDVAAATIGVFLLLAGGAKLESPGAISAALATLRISDRWHGLVAVWVGLAESLLGFSLILAPGRPLLVVAAGVLLAFAAIEIMFVRLTVDSCGCLGEITTQSTPAVALARTITLFTIASLGSLLPETGGNYYLSALLGLQIAVTILIATEATSLLIGLRLRRA